MTHYEIKQKIQDYRNKGMIKTVVHRTCSKPDIDGLRDIIKNNPSVCVLNIIANPARAILETLNEEHFESCDDPEFSKIARSVLCEGLGVKCQ